MGEGYDACLRGLAAASGIPTPPRAELARLGRERRKKGSNKNWMHPKDGRTHLAPKAERAVDLETGVVVGVTAQDASAGDKTTMVEMLITAVQPAGRGLAEVVAAKAYRGNETMVALGLRGDVPAPDHSRRRLAKCRNRSAPDGAGATHAPPATP